LTVDLTPSDDGTFGLTTYNRTSIAGPWATPTGADTRKGHSPVPGAPPANAPFLAKLKAANGSPPGVQTFSEPM